ncbi:hypothetical protein, partial [Tropicimonas sp. IMCC6043]|uniref:hypothetical protein n=1 Tax=Tropicimonas sp. IMCC6043 TaxID=2510645 RepID=UPI001A91351A
ASRHTLIQMPPPLRPRTKPLGAFLADLGGEDRAKALSPEPDGLVTDLDRAFVQQFLDISDGSREATLYQRPFWLTLGDSQTFRSLTHCC